MRNDYILSDDYIYFFIIFFFNISLKIRFEKIVMKLS